MKILKYSLIILLITFLFGLSYPNEAAAAKKRIQRFRNDRYAALVVDARTGNILHQENSDKLRYPASLTKMMTLYLAFEAVENGQLRMNQVLTVSRRASSQPKMRIGFRPGDKISVRDAILGLIVKSANDASVVLGEAIAGSEMQFALLMTRKARKLGMNRTTFQNSSGLHHPRQRTSARDMAKLAIALQRDFPQYYSLFSRTSFTYKGRVYVGHNRVIKNYRGADGVKTGYIRTSGFNLVTSATRDGQKLVGVVLGGNTAVTRDRRMMALLDSAFSKFSGNIASSKSRINKKKSAARKVSVKKNLTALLVVKKKGYALA